MQVPKTEPADRLFKVDTSFNRITYGMAANSRRNLNLDIQGVAVFTSSSKRNERNVPAIPLQFDVFEQWQRVPFVIDVDSKEAHCRRVRLRDDVRMNGGITWNLFPLSVSNWS